MTQATELITVAISAAVPTGAVSYLIVKLTIKAELATFLRDLNGTYMRSKECKKEHEKVCIQITNLERDVEETKTYAHHAKHWLANQIQKLVRDGAT